MTALQELLALKPGWRTTEFWKSAILAGFALLAGFHLIPNGLPDQYSVWVQLAAFLAAAGVSIGYAVSRGLAKSGPSTMVDLVSGAIRQLVGEEDPDGKKLLGQLLPTLEAKTPPDVFSAVKLLEAVTHDLSYRVEQHGKQLDKLGQPVAMQLPVPNTSTTAAVSYGGSSVNEPADGALDSGPGGFPADLSGAYTVPAAAPVASAAGTASTASTVTA